jgi:hypothetical protein
MNHPQGIIDLGAMTLSSMSATVLARWIAVYTPDRALPMHACDCFHPSKSRPFSGRLALI